MPLQIEIDGDGVAATCCAKLLQLRGANVSFQPAEGRPVSSRPVLLINEQTRRLLGDVFGSDDGLFADAIEIRRRVVLWDGAEARAQSFPHSGLAVREGVLLERLWRKIGSTRCAAGCDWRIQSAPQSDDRTGYEFGSRRAVTAAVELRNADDDACWIESTADGWLFLIATGHGSGSLIAVGASAAMLLGQSRLIIEQINTPVKEGTGFAAYPRISMPLCGPGFLACGTAAMSFDPICGEGAGHAVREAILASAVLGTIHNGASVSDALGQYSARLMAAFARHLQLCRQFYVSGRQSRWWDTEVEELERGLEWTRAQLAIAASPSGRLVGFDLRHGTEHQQ